MPILTAALLREILAYDPQTGVFTWKKSARCGWVGKVAGHVNSDGYIVIKIGRVLHRAHRLAWLYVYEKWPDGEIDHRHRNRTDNRIGELRDATSRQNKMNMKRRRDNVCGLKGVGICKKTGRWRAKITVNGRQIHLGYFDTRESAFAAYGAAAKRYFGEYARIE